MKRLFSTTLALETWGDFHISATALDVNATPSFPSPSVLIRIPPPIGLTAVQTSGNSVQLIWNAIANISTTFQIERSIPGGPSTILAPSVSGASYLDPGFDPASLYRVTGFKGTQMTAMSPEVSVTLFDGDHDGIPDAWERTHGLNPGDLADAEWS